MFIALFEATRQKFNFSLQKTGFGVPQLPQSLTLLRLLCDFNLLVLFLTISWLLQTVAAVDQQLLSSARENYVFYRWKSGGFIVDWYYCFSFPSEKTVWQQGKVVKMLEI